MSKKFLQALGLTVALIGMSEIASAQTKGCCTLYADCKSDAKQLEDDCHYIKNLGTTACKNLGDAVYAACEGINKSCGCTGAENKEK